MVNDKKGLIAYIWYVTIYKKEVREVAKMINLKEFRQKWGLTQLVCAVEVGVSLQTWNLWEKGGNKPSLDNYEKLQKFLALYEEE